MKQPAIISLAFLFLLNNHLFNKKRIYLVVVVNPIVRIRFHVFTRIRSYVDYVSEVVYEVVWNLNRHRDGRQGICI